MCVTWYAGAARGGGYAHLCRRRDKFMRPGMGDRMAASQVSVAPTSTSTYFLTSKVPESIFTL